MNKFFTVIKNAVAGPTIRTIPPPQLPPAGDGRVIQTQQSGPGPTTGFTAHEAQEAKQEVFGKPVDPRDEERLKWEAEADKFFAPPGPTFEDWLINTGKA